MSRTTSQSGKMAPSISDQVMRRPRFIGCAANRSSPRKTALPINAPAMPWVMVSMVKVYRKRHGPLNSLDEQKRFPFGDGHADAARRDAVAIQHRQCVVTEFGRDGHQQAAGSLRIEEQVAEFLRNRFPKTDAIAKKIAVILQAAGKESIARGFRGARQIADRRVIEFQGHGLDLSLGISQRHLPGMSEQAESRNVRYGMNWLRSPGLFLQFS